MGLQYVLGVGPIEMAILPTSAYVCSISGTWTPQRMSWALVMILKVSVWRESQD